MASSRLPPLTKDELPASSQPFNDELSAVASKAFGPPGNSLFKYQAASGALIGPFPFLLAAPQAGSAFMALNSAVNSIPGLPADAREVAILATGAKFEAAFELYAHTAVAEKGVGLSREAVFAVARGDAPPEGLSEACGVAFEVATALTRRQGPLPSELWEKSVRVLGRDGTVALVHFIGMYAYTCIVLNAMDAPVPLEG